MSATKKKNIRIKRKKPSLDSSNVIIVMHTVEKETLFPEKLKKANDMLSKAKMLDS
jgi:hypothetical protein